MIKLILILVPSGRENGINESEFFHWFIEIFKKLFVTSFAEKNSF